MTTKTQVLPYASTIARRIAVRLVREALEAGYAISVNDGEETTLVRSTDRDAILAAMGTTSEDYLHLFRKDGTYLGWVWLIWENGCDLISDNTANPEMDAMLDPIYEWAESLDQ